MEKDIIDENIKKRLCSFRKETNDEIKYLTKNVNELFNFNPVFEDFVSNTEVKDENINRQLDECLEMLREKHDYYMFEHKVCVLIVRYGNKGVNIHDNFLNILKDDLYNLKNHFNKKDNKVISKDYIERCITKIVSVVEPLLIEVQENIRYEEYLKRKEKFLEKKRKEMFYKPLPLEKLKIIKEFISREDFERALIEYKFKPSLTAFSKYIKNKCISIENDTIHRKAKEYYDLI